MTNKALGEDAARATAGWTGVVAVDKAKGPTSHDVVQEIRRIFGQRRSGHTGTLDPLATGLLPVCLGRATRLARFLSGSSKSYRAVVRFGFATDTYDATGIRIGRQCDVVLDGEELSAILPSFLGEQQQVPPPFAAKKIQGQRMYRLACAGIAIEPRPVRVLIRNIRLLAVKGPLATLEVTVESGTYIRSLAHDLGQRMGVGAHLEELRRMRVGPLSLERSFSLGALEELARKARLHEAVLAPEKALSHLVALRLSRAGAARVAQGRGFLAADVVEGPGDVQAGQSCRLLGPAGQFLGVGLVQSAMTGEVRPLVVLCPKEKAAGVEPDSSSGFTG